MTGVAPIHDRRGARPEALLAVSIDAARARRKDGPAWLEARRASALALLEAHGLPGEDAEAFRFTPTRDVIRETRAVAARSTSPEVALRADGDSIRLGERRGSVEVRSLAEVLRTEPERVEPHLGSIAVPADGFSAQNTALFEDGLVVFAHAGAAGELHVSHTVPGDPGSVLGVPRVLVVAERMSALTVVETRDAAAGSGGGGLSSAVTEVSLGDGARVEHVRIAGGSTGTGTLETLAVRQGRGSRFVSRAFTFGGALARLDLRVLLDGEGAECSLDGLYVARDGDMIDHHTLVDHAVPHCSSRQRYKGVLDGRSTAVFDGTVVVRHGAYRTEAHQENRNLLLSGDAVIHTKPHLRIDADDVKCSHGATVGRLDPAQLFYLRSRGLEPSVARSLLTFAFLRELTDSAPEGLSRVLAQRLLALFPDGALAGELA